MTDNHIGETAERALADKLAAAATELSAAADECAWAAHLSVMDPFIERMNTVLHEYDRIRTAPPVADSRKELPRITGISRRVDLFGKYGDELVLHFARRPTNDEMSAIHEHLLAHPSPEVRAVKEEGK